MNNKLKIFFLVSISLIFVFADLCIKQFFSEHYQDQELVYFNPFIDLTYFRNTGISFSWFDHVGWIKNLFVFSYSIIAILVYLYLIWKKRNNNLMSFSIVLVLSGTIGDFYDRIKFGFVVDYIHIHYNDFSFFVFNLADIFIFIGFCYIIYWFFLVKMKKALDE